MDSLDALECPEPPKGHRHPAPIQDGSDVYVAMMATARKDRCVFVNETDGTLTVIEAETGNVEASGCAAVDVIVKYGAEVWKVNLGEWH